MNGNTAVDRDVEHHIAAGGDVNLLVVAAIEVAEGHRLVDRVVEDWMPVGVVVDVVPMAGVGQPVDNVDIGVVGL